MPNTTVPAAATGLPEETRNIRDAIDLLCRAISLNELTNMAGEGLARDCGDAIVTGAVVIGEVLDEVKAILYANIERERSAS